MQESCKNKKIKLIFKLLMNKAKVTFLKCEIYKSSGFHMHNNYLYKIKTKIAVNLFISANALYDEAVRNLSEKYNFEIDAIIRIVSFDSNKTSIYRWKFDFKSLTGILDSANFNITEIDLQNGRSFFLKRDLDGRKMIIACDFDMFEDCQ